ncbi:MAG: aminotransferase class I/II-fold pyridoxal phosphate-dependent enzyme [Actinomycetota bacterium]|nr:aminotransferase class I/II-fold pyridoxal phosphate-dependent enzyme [Actinomycetota bacterium]
MSATPEPPPLHRGENTRAVHLPEPPPVPQRPLGLPVHRTAGFEFSSAAEFGEVLDGTRPGFSYSRVDNPTAAAFAAAVAALEGANVGAEIVGEPFASGQAATSTLLLGLTRAGGHVVAQRELFGGTYSLLRRLEAFGVAVEFVDGSDPAAVGAALRPETCLLWVETLANPTMSVANLPALAAAARQAGVPLIVDSTFASPAVCRPLEHGADLVMHSATKYLGGHSDVTGGVVVGRPELLAPVRAARVDLGGSLAPDEAFLLRRGLSTLPLRVARHCASALAFAEAISGHPRVTRVDYPGLSTHRDHELAGRLFTSARYGGVVTLSVAGGRAAGQALCDGLRLVRNASSLGGVHSVVSHVASTTHRQLDDAALAAAGIDPSAVRVSIGLEDADDLIADVRQALDALPDFTH